MQHVVIFKLERDKVLVYKVETNPLSFKAFQNKGRDGYHLDNENRNLDRFWEWFDNVTGIVKKTDFIKGCVLVNNEKDELFNNFNKQILCKGYHFIDEKENKWNEKVLKEFIKYCTPYVDVIYDRKKELFKNNDIELLVKGLGGRVVIQFENTNEINIKPKLVKTKQGKARGDVREPETSQTQSIENSADDFIVVPVKKRTKPIPKEKSVKGKRTQKDNLKSNFGEPFKETLPEMTSEDVQDYINERTKDHCRVVDFE